MAQVHEQEEMLQELRRERAELQEEVRLREKENSDALYALDKELRALNFIEKTDRQDQLDKLDNARTKIEICKFKQQEAIEETIEIQKELNQERRKYRIIEEQL